MKRSLFAGLLMGALILGGCGESPPAQAPSTPVASAEQEPSSKPEPEPTPEGPVYPVLNAVNAPDFLDRYGQENPESLIRINTTKGAMTIRLYEDTPLHRANFIMLIKRQYFDQAIFYRVVQGFVIQGGDTDDEERLALRQEIGAYYVPAEFHAHHFHRKGMLAMARNYTDNPDKKSSPYIFYIVHGTKATPAELDAVQAENGHTFPAAHRSYYTSAPGTPHLDGEHTVFGEVVEGLDVIDSIAAVKVDGGDWPINNVVMNIEILE